MLTWSGAMAGPLWRELECDHAERRDQVIDSTPRGKKISRNRQWPSGRRSATSRTPTTSHP